MTVRNSADLTRVKVGGVLRVQTASVGWFKASRCFT